MFCNFFSNTNHAAHGIYKTWFKNRFCWFEQDNRLTEKHLLHPCSFYFHLNYVMAKYNHASVIPISNIYVQYLKKQNMNLDE